MKGLEQSFQRSPPSVRQVVQPSDHSTGVDWFPWEQLRRSGLSSAEEICDTLTSICSSIVPSVLLSRPDQKPYVLSRSHRFVLALPRRSHDPDTPHHVVFPLSSPCPHYETLLHPSAVTEFSLGLKSSCEKMQHVPGFESVVETGNALWTDPPGFCTCSSSSASDHVTPLKKCINFLLNCFK